VSATTLMVVVIGHVLMAVKHHVIDRDRIFGRMIPGLRVD
jgi:cytochrome b561